jgi:hypothetical protein
MVKMGVFKIDKEKHDTKLSNIEDEEEDNEIRSSSLSDISNGQIFMPLSPTPDSLNYEEYPSLNKKNKKEKAFEQPTVKINSPKSLNEGGVGSRLGGGVRFGMNATQSVTNTPIRKTRVPISTQQQQLSPLNGILNKPSDKNDFLSFFEPEMDDYDITLYAKNFSKYNNAYHHTPRLIDYDEDQLIFERIKNRIAKRDLSIINRTKNPDKNVVVLNDFISKDSHNKELNVKIDITTDGAKIREMTKSRNSNNFMPTNRTTNSRLLNLDYLNDDFLLNSKRNAALPSLNLSNNNNNLKKSKKKENVNNNSNNGNFDLLNNSSSLDEINKSFDALKNPNNIHNYLYSLSKKTQFESKSHKLRIITFYYCYNTSVFF